MKRKIIIAVCMLVTSITLTSCGSSEVFLSAKDITPGNSRGEKMDWRYGATDIRIQTTKINSQLLDRWYAKTMYNVEHGKPRIIITEVDNRTDTYISTDMIRDIIEGVAVDDGRYTILVGKPCDVREVDMWLKKIIDDPKYKNSSQLAPNTAIAPQFLGKIRITKAVTSSQKYDYEDYRMTVTLYDIETHEAIDSAWDVLSKKVVRPACS